MFNLLIKDTKVKQEPGRKEEREKESNGSIFQPSEVIVRDFLTLKMDAIDVLQTVGSSLNNSTVFFNSMCQMDPKDLHSSFAKKHTKEAFFDPWMESYVANDSNIYKLNAKAFRAMTQTPHGLEWAKRTVYSDEVDETIEKLLNVSYEDITTVEGLLKLTQEVYLHLQSIEESKLHCLMSDSKNELVGWSRSLIPKDKIRWIKGKHWAYTLYLMGISLPFGSFNIPHIGMWLRGLFPFAEANHLNPDSLGLEIDLFFYLIFGSVFNTQVSFFVRLGSIFVRLLTNVFR